MRWIVPLLALIVVLGSLPVITRGCPGAEERPESNPARTPGEDTEPPDIPSAEGWRQALQILTAHLEGVPPGLLSDVAAASRLLIREQAAYRLLQYGRRRDPIAPGVHELVLTAEDLGIEETAPEFASRFLVSVPAGYRDERAWPLVIALPPRGVTPREYLDGRFGDAGVRDRQIVAVLDFEDYGDIEVEVTEEVVRAGQFRLATVKRTVPFSWEMNEAKARFWRHFVDLTARRFRVDPDRVVLAGDGLGATGALRFATTDAYRFAGLVLAGPTASRLDPLQNLAAVPLLLLPPQGGRGPDDRTREALEAAGANVREGDPSELPARLAEWERNRYPLPAEWEIRDTGYCGYWTVVRELHDKTTPATIRVERSATRNAIRVETENVALFDLLLNDVLADLDEPVRVVVNGRDAGAFEVTRSADGVLRRSMIWNGEARVPTDPGCVFPASIEGIRVPR